MSLNIKDPEAHRLAQEIARATGETMTRVVTEALRDRLARSRRREVGQASRNCWRSPTGRRRTSTPLCRPRGVALRRAGPPEMIVDTSALVAILYREPEAKLHRTNPRIRRLPHQRRDLCRTVDGRRKPARS